MRYLSPVLCTQLLGVLVGAALGASRTAATAAQLLAKNQALLAAGLPTLPGSGHLQTLDSAAPAWAGALFFGLSLGLGWGSLCAVWLALTRSLPASSRPYAMLLTAAPAAYCAVNGDPGLALALLAIAGGSAWIGARSAAAQGRYRAWTQLLLAVLCGAGLVPWATAEEGPFTRLRDQVLLASGAGLAVNHFYYRWTLYPAETLKPLANRSQPLAAIGTGVSATAGDTFCRQAQRFGILCIAEEPAADVILRAEKSGLSLTRGRHAVPWPAQRSDQETAWSGFSNATDQQQCLRRMTGWALFLGCPLGLCWLLAGIARTLAAGCGTRRLRAGVALLAALALASLLAAPGLADPDMQQLRQELARPDLTFAALGQALQSPLPVERLHAARAARRSGPRSEPLLLEALTDPVINVRYAAAQSLGYVGGKDAQLALSEIMTHPEDWYVKERAYGALRRIGWPARP